MAYTAAVRETILEWIRTLSVKIWASCRPWPVMKSVSWSTGCRDSVAALSACLACRRDASSAGPAVAVHGAIVGNSKHLRRELRGMYRPA